MTGTAGTGGGTTVERETGDHKTIDAGARTMAFRPALAQNGTRPPHLVLRMTGPCPHHLYHPDPMATVMLLGA